MALVNMDLNNYEEEVGFEVLPPGWYEAQVVDSDIKEGGKGQYINWTLDIVGKPNKVWDIMSLSNDISLKRLKTMAVCCGHPNPNFLADTEELHGKFCQIRLKIEKDKTGTYEDKNRITAFKPSKPSNTPANQIETEAKAEPTKKPWE